MRSLVVVLILALSTSVSQAASSGGGSAPAPAQKPVSTNLPLTSDEVKKHNSASDCWSIIDGVVYDLTNWVDSHPGGSSRITAICGKDGTSNFLGQHNNSNSAKSRLKGFELGKLEAAAIPATPTPVAPATKQLSVFLSEADALIKQKNFTAALNLLKQANKSYANNADINNLLGFSSRNLKQFAASAKYYKKALRINPNHLGALEYQGELFLQTKKVSAAKKNLAKLKKLCGKNCEEYLDLKKAIGSK
ncbi:MAG: tetratricopeptide repeat protein [Actinomycetota bacterium]|nr:tetratricopeptide repeat protein [Actinomycetota bacterium]